MSAVQSEFWSKWRLQVTVLIQNVRYTVCKCIRRTSISLLLPSWRLISTYKFDECEVISRIRLLNNTCSRTVLLRDWTSSNRVMVLVNRTESTQMPNWMTVLQSPNRFPSRTWKIPFLTCLNSSIHQLRKTNHLPCRNQTIRRKTSLSACMWAQL